MAIRIHIKASDTNDVVKMDVEPEDIMEEIIDSAASYWDKDPTQHVLMRGNQVLEGETRVSDVDIKNDEVLVLVDKNRVSTKDEVLDKYTVLGRDWIFENIGFPKMNLVLDKEDFKGNAVILTFQNSANKKRYQVTIEEGKVKEYRPL